MVEVNDTGKVRVFVYGTLKQGHGNNPLLADANADFVGYDSVSGMFRLYDLGGIPALVHDESSPESEVRGQIFALEDEGLAALDHLEGHPKFYRRSKVWSDRLKKRVWVYFLAAPQFIDKAADITDQKIWKANKSEAAWWANHENQA